MKAQRDEYKNFKELSAAEHKRNYSIKSDELINNCRFLIFTPHGGGIETGTSEIVREIAYNISNFYCFEGNNRKCKRMHITSHKFNEPVLLELLKKHETAISIHGMADTQGCDIYIGGLNGKLIDTISSKLRKGGFNVITNSEKRIKSLAALSKTNVTNRCKSKRGVQIEIADSLRKKFFNGDYRFKKGREIKTKEFNKFCQVIRGITTET